VKNPIKIKMTSAGMIATVHLTIRTTIDRKGILMSVTTTFMQSSDILVFS
jgi:GTP cyclohydrolase FolE2